MQWNTPCMQILTSQVKMSGHQVRSKSDAHSGTGFKLEDSECCGHSFSPNVFFQVEVFEWIPTQCISCPACIVCHRGFKLGRFYDDLGTSNLYISDFLYLWPKVRSVPWPLHDKSMEKDENASRSVCTDRNSQNLLESWWFGTATITKVRL